MGPKISDASTSNPVRINNITYLFNEKGNPVYGLRRLEVGTSGQYACYFFGADKATSSVVKGKGNVVEGDGTTGQFYFTDSGNKAGRGYQVWRMDSCTTWVSFRRQTAVPSMKSLKSMTKLSGNDERQGSEIQHREGCERHKV